MMGKPITGQYECVHSSGVGLDYFTSRIDRITLQPNGRFILTIQKQSRVTNAAQSFIKGQQVTAAAPDMRREGTYTYQGTSIAFTFDDGGQDQGSLAVNGDGLQIGPNHFNKVSDSTVLPPARRMKQDMDDIAKGLKIASTIGGFAVKAAKTLQGGIQSAQGTGNQPAAAQPVPPAQPPVARSVPPVQPAANAVPATPAAAADRRFCDQCGANIRPGKRFCNNCGAHLG